MASVIVPIEPPDLWAKAISPKPFAPLPLPGWRQLMWGRSIAKGFSPWITIDEIDVFAKRVAKSIYALFGKRMGTAKM